MPLHLFRKGIPEVRNLFVQLYHTTFSLLPSLHKSTIHMKCFYGFKLFIHTNKIYKFTKRQSKTPNVSKLNKTKCYFL